MRFFGRKKKQNQQADRARSDAPQQRVISYYTASRRQLDNFERTSPQSETSLAYRRIERVRSSWFTLLIAVVVILVVGYLASLGSKPHVTLQGTQYRSLSEYTELTQKAFGNDLRSRVKPLLPSSKLEQAVSQAIPEARTVTVTSSFLGHRPEVKIVTDDAVAVFSQLGSSDLVLSTRGRLLLPAGQSDVPLGNLPIIENLTGIKGEAGEQFMRPDETQAFTRLLAQFSADKSKPVFTLNTTPHEILAKESGRGGYTVKFLLTDTITSQYGSLRATEKKLSEISQKPSEYIDVRLVDKVYYK